MTKERELFPSIETRRSFTVKEAALLLGMSVPGVHVWIQRGRIRRPSRVSKRGGYRIPREEIVRLLSSVGREVPGLWTAKRTKVLVIEDHPQVSEYVAHALRAPEYAVEIRTAATPEDGLLVAIPFSPAVILLDQFRPKEGMTSDQALAILRRAKALKGVRIIGCWHPVRPGARGPGPDAFLPKPFGLDELREAIMGLPPGALGRARDLRTAPPDRRRWEYRVRQPAP